MFKMNRIVKSINGSAAVIFLAAVLTACSTDVAPVHPTHYEVVTSYVTVSESSEPSDTQHHSKYIPFDFEGVPAYSGDAVHIVNFNMPYFMEHEITDDSFESYSQLDDLGRCGPAFACLSKDTMPDDLEKRGAIGNIRPSGWHTVKYPEFIADNYLYNRCHLIGWQLSAENANPQNLITGTRYMNITGMLPYENMVSDYILSTNNHVMYRATPVFVDDELVCHGVLLEAQSVEDNDCVFCVFCYNVQPAIKIDYATGDSHVDDDYAGIIPDKTGDTDIIYVINTRTRKVHRPYCSAVSSIDDVNKSIYSGNISDLLDNGYSSCKLCDPE